MDLLKTVLSKRVDRLMGSTLGLPGTRVSQHLSLLRLHRMVEERRDGRHRDYSLLHPEFTGWIVEGLEFVEGRITGVSESDIQICTGVMDRSRQSIVFSGGY